MLADRYPRMVQECIDRGWEIAGHGISATQMITSDISLPKEKETIASVMAMKKIPSKPPLFEILSVLFAHFDGNVNSK